MEEKRDLIESTVRSCTSRLGGAVTELQIQGLMESLLEMKDIKEVADSLAISVDKFFGRPEQKEQYDACMEDILQLAGEIYNSKDDIIAQLQENKSKNYTPRKYFG
jgi:hypothetical protein